MLGRDRKGKKVMGRRRGIEEGKKGRVGEEKDRRWVWKGERLFSEREGKKVTEGKTGIWSKGRVLERKGRRGRKGKWRWK